MSDLLYKKEKTAADIDCILLQHKNLVYFILSKMNQLSNPDAESAAWEALWDAVGTFDIYATNAFSTYACKLIRNAVNNVLRKQQLEHTRYCATLQYYGQSDLVCDIELDDANVVATIDKAFKDFIKTKSGRIRDILVIWYGTGFATRGVDIAAICNCSPSYVTRAQNCFRAFLSSRLKES